MVMPMAQQIQRMSSRYPDFRIIANGGWSVIWEGELRPLAQRYRVRVMLVLKSRVGNMRVVVPSPRVWLVDPPLQLESKYAPGKAVPHIYPNLEDPLRSHLCLFDPAQQEWNWDMSIADTTIPWAIDWLVSYEGWLATGEWTGGGRDHLSPAAA